MFSLLLPALAAFSAHVVAQTHGAGAEGTEMGPVAFLWPPDRNWTAQADNIAPCGSPDGPSNRTEFPLSQGAVALTIADEAWNVAIRLATGNDPRTQADFIDDQVVSNVSEVDPGHQCYKLQNNLEGITAGTNATIQMEYWGEFEGENNGNNQSFFACADITFVAASDFKTAAPCFNVTSSDFEIPASNSSATAAPTSSAPSSSSSSSSSNSGGSGLSTGAKAGIAVGSIIGGLALVGLVGFLLWRRGKATGLKGKEEYELRAKNLGSPAPGEEARS